MTGRPFDRYRNFIAASSARPDASCPQEPAWVADVAAAPAGLLPAAVTADARSTERSAAAGRFAASREDDCSVARRACDHCAPAVLDDSAPADWEPVDLAVPDLVEHDFPAEAAPDDHCAPAVLDDSAPADWEPVDLAAPGLVGRDFPAEVAPDDHFAPAANWVAFPPGGCSEPAEPAVAGWAAADSAEVGWAAAGNSVARLGDDRSSPAVRSAVLAQVGHSLPADSPAHSRDGSSRLRAWRGALVSLVALPRCPAASSASAAELRAAPDAGPALAASGQMTAAAAVVSPWRPLACPQSQPAVRPPDSRCWLAPPSRLGALEAPPPAR
jgi:hypothetical protein